MNHSIVPQTEERIGALYELSKRIEEQNVLYTDYLKKVQDLNVNAEDDDAEPDVQSTHQVHEAKEELQKVKMELTKMKEELDTTSAARGKDTSNYLCSTYKPGFMWSFTIEEIKYLAWLERTFKFKPKLLVDRDLPPIEKARINGLAAQYGLEDVQEVTVTPMSPTSHKAEICEGHEKREEERKESALEVYRAMRAK